MVETITPVVYGGSKRRWLVGVAMMTLGATVVAGAFGALLGAAGAAFRGPWGASGLVATGALALAYAAREVTGLRIPVLQARRQVPEWWRTFFPPNVAALLYGAGLGVGFFTYLTYGTLVVVAALAIALASPAIGVALMVPFGLTRALTVLVAYGTDSSAVSQRLVDRLAELGRSRVPSIANAVALIAMAVVAGLGAAALVPDWNVSELALGMLGLTFAWAAAAKVIGTARWRGALEGYGLSSRTQGVVAVLVPLAEGAVAICIATGFLLAGSWFSLVLLVAFSAAILRARAVHGAKLDCGCFGSTARRDYRVMLLRNAALGVAAIIGLAGGAGSVPDLTGVDILPLLLSIIGLALVTWVVRVSSTALRGGRR